MSVTMTDVKLEDLKEAEVKLLEVRARIMDLRREHLATVDGVPHIVRLAAAEFHDRMHALSMEYQNMHNHFQSCLSSWAATQ